MQSQVAVKYHVWDGRKKTYEMWRGKFMINCAKQKCIAGFQIKDEDLPKLPEKGTTDDKKKE